MKRSSFVIAFCLLVSVPAMGQILESLSKKRSDSLYSVLHRSNNDTEKMVICRRLASYYGERNRDSAIYFSEQQLSLAKKLKQPLWQGWALSIISYELHHLGNYAKAFDAANNALALAEDEGSEAGMYPMEKEGVFVNAHKVRFALLGNIYQKFGHLHRSTGNETKALENYLKAISMSESVEDNFGLTLYNISVGALYIKTGKLDSALQFLRKAVAISNAKEQKLWLGYAYLTISKIYLQEKKYDSVRYYLQSTVEISRQIQNLPNEAEAYGGLALLFLTFHQPDSAISYANYSVRKYEQLNDQRNISINYVTLAKAYQLTGDKDSSLKYLWYSKNLADSITLADKVQTSRYQNLNVGEQFRLLNIEKEKIKFETKVRMYAMLTAIVVFMVIAVLLYRNNRNRKKTNTLLSSQKETLQSTLNDLKSTQSQLIQSEKMASLGELTAGIAHEIQNPLNFVNNFSEVSKELLSEMKAELVEGNTDEAREIADDVIQNLDKIHHHGQRADAIVKGMLQHSQSSSGKKEPTDINALADEYLRLSYHGLRAKDKSFNATLVTDFDERIGHINIIPQDIGRVILNLITNAFYAVVEKKKQFQPELPERSGQVVKDYEPTVSVRTEKSGDKVLIIVNDNGSGIPQKVLDKIFQPFFTTTKPTGQGTGLGLSLSYDIITKGHGGELKVETKEGEGTSFIITLFIVT